MAEFQATVESELALIASGMREPIDSKAEEAGEQALVRLCTTVLVDLHRVADSLEVMAASQQKAEISLYRLSHEAPDGVA